MDPSALAAAFLTTMGMALSCFWRAAWFRRRDLRRHVRWALAGVAIDLLGTVAVLVVTKGLGWRIPPAFPVVARVHRVFAWAATALVLLQVVTGYARHPLHPRQGPVFLAVYTVTYALALCAYGPWR